MRALRSVRLLSLAGCLGFGAGCVDRPDRLSVEQIEVLDESDAGTALDIEVHLFDEATDAHLGCASLERVDESDVIYDGLDVPIEGARGPLTREDLFGRDVRVQVIEDDTRPCPTEPEISAGDDPVGTSGPIAGEEIGRLGVISFGNVSRLLLLME